MRNKLEKQVKNKIDKVCEENDKKTLKRINVILNVFNNRNVPVTFKTQEERINLVNELNLHDYVNQVLLKI
jgi:GTP-binding protein EngB required for normal cell division